MCCSTSLATGAASNPPKGSVQHRNDGGTDEYLGAAPPEGHGPNRYIICVTAVDVPELEVDDPDGEARKIILA